MIDLVIGQAGESLHLQFILDSSDDAESEDEGVGEGAIEHGSLARGEGFNHYLGF